MALMMMVDQVGGEYWPHDVAASLSTPHPRTRKGGGGGEEGGGERGGDGEGEGGG